MRIGELAERAGVSTRALRYYEEQGLISARRAHNGYRDYDEDDLRVKVAVELRDGQPVAVLGLDLLKDRRDHLARRAPLRPELHDHRHV